MPRSQAPAPPAPLLLVPPRVARPALRALSGGAHTFSRDGGPRATGAARTNRNPVKGGRTSCRRDRAASASGGTNRASGADHQPSRPRATPFARRVRTSARAPVRARASARSPTPFTMPPRPPRARPGRQSVGRSGVTPRNRPVPRPGTHGPLALETVPCHTRSGTSARSEASLRHAPKPSVSRPVARGVHRNGLVPGRSAGHGRRAGPIAAPRASGRGVRGVRGDQPASAERPLSPGRACRSYAVRAASRSRRQEVTVGRRRSNARRSRSVMPPHTPCSIRRSSAWARHSVRTGQAVQTAFASFCVAPSTNSSSGSLVRHAARAPHVSSVSTPLPSSPRSGLPCTTLCVWQFGERTAIAPGAERRRPAAIPSSERPLPTAPEGNLTDPQLPCVRRARAHGRELTPSGRVVLARTRRLHRDQEAGRDAERYRRPVARDRSWVARTGVGRDPGTRLVCSGHGLRRAAGAPAGVARVPRVAGPTSSTRVLW